jgi:hypothetical protein
MIASMVVQSFTGPHSVSFTLHPATGKCYSANEAMREFKHVYKVRPRKDKRGIDLISDVLPFGRLWYGEPNALSNAIGYASAPQPLT